MSALGQKRTYAVHNGMSALPPKADMCGAVDDVRYGPKSGHQRSTTIGASGGIGSALLDAPAFLRRGLLDRDGDNLGAWGMGTDYMIRAAHDELQRVVARRELKHRLRLAMHQMDMVLVHWYHHAGFREGRIDD